MEETQKERRGRKDREAKARWREANREESRRRSAVWAANNREAARLKTAAWRIANPERVKQNTAISVKQRKDRWSAFLQQERERYRKNPAKKLAQIQAAKARDPAPFSATMHRHYLNNKPEYAARVAARRAARLRATPSWCDKAGIVALFNEAQRLTRETGIPHEVDHIVPLIGKNVRGLHIPQNMQVITRLENRRKSNRVVDAEAAGETDRLGLPCP
jgi:hypothetical protein